jgi:hypothetical protein
MRFRGNRKYGSLIVSVIVATIKRPPAPGLILKQLYDIGVASLPVVAITGFSTGLVLAAQSFYQLADKGLTSVTGLMVAKAMMTELGPVLTFHGHGTRGQRCARTLQCVSGADRCAQRGRCQTGIFTSRLTANVYCLFSPSLVSAWGGEVISFRPLL